MTEKVLEIGDAIRKGIQDGLKARGIMMTAEEAKRIILDDPDGNIVKRMEAIAVARSILGEDCTMEEVWKWAGTSHITPKCSAGYGLRGFYYAQMRNITRMLIKPHVLKKHQMYNKMPKR